MYFCLLINKQDANSTGQRQQSGNQSKSGSKQGGYTSSTYWNTQN